MTTERTTPAGDDRDELVELYVPARERPATARKLLDAVRAAGQHVGLVVSTTDGYAVPRWLAEDADLVLPDTVAVEQTGRAGIPLAYPITGEPAAGDEQAGEESGGEESGGDVEGDPVDPMHDADQADPVEAPVDADQAKETDEATPKGKRAARGTRKAGGAK